MLTLHERDIFMISQESAVPFRTWHNQKHTYSVSPFPVAMTARISARRENKQAIDASKSAEARNCRSRTILTLFGAQSAVAPISARNIAAIDLFETVHRNQAVRGNAQDHRPSAERKELGLHPIRDAVRRDSGEHQPASPCSFHRIYREALVPRCNISDHSPEDPA